MNNKDLFIDDDGGYIRLPRALVKMVFHCVLSCKPCWIYLWMLVNASYGTLKKKNKVILHIGEVELNVNEMVQVFNCSPSYLYRTFNKFIKYGLLKRKRANIYELLMYSKHCNCIVGEKEFVDQEKLVGSFREFWKVYYKEVKIVPTDRYRCEQLWAKMDPDEREVAFQFIKKYREFSDGHKFKKSAYNYLKDKTYYKIEDQTIFD